MATFMETWTMLWLYGGCFLFIIVILYHIYLKQVKCIMIQDLCEFVCPFIAMMAKPFGGESTHVLYYVTVAEPKGAVKAWLQTNCMVTVVYLAVIALYNSLDAVESKKESSAFYWSLAQILFEQLIISFYFYFGIETNNRLCVLLSSVLFMMKFCEGLGLFCVESGVLWHLLSHLEFSYLGYLALRILHTMLIFVRTGGFFLTAVFGYKAWSEMDGYVEELNASGSNYGDRTTTTVNGNRRTPNEIPADSL